MLQISKPIAAVGVPVQPELGRPKQIDGPTLNRWARKAGATTRAFIACDLQAGRLVVTGMTAKQARALSRASLGYAATVANLTPDERERVERGAISLAKLHRQPRSLGDAELDRVIARVGVERTWQALLRALPQN